MYLPKFSDDLFFLVIRFKFFKLSPVPVLFTKSSKLYNRKKIPFPLLIFYNVKKHIFLEEVMPTLEEIRPKSPKKRRLGQASDAKYTRSVAGAQTWRKKWGVTNLVQVANLLAFLVSAGARTFRRIVVATDSEPPGPPCGACRQVLAEFGSELEVESVGPTQSRRWTIRELLPDAFTGDFLS